MTSSRRAFLRMGAAAGAVALMPSAASADHKRKETPFRGTVRCLGKPIAGVVVSDGLVCVKTDAKGAYEIPYRAAARFITVTVPSGYRAEWPSLGAHHRGDRQDFHLLPWEASAGRGCTFVHISDSEIDCTAEERVWVDRVRELADESGAAFVVHTGDICGRCGIVAHNRLMNDVSMGRPCVYVIGNHDFVEGPTGADVFEANFGPVWRSFEAGGIHFVVTPMPYGDWDTGFTQENITAWLRNDLAQIDRTMPVVLFNHMLPIWSPEGSRPGQALGRNPPLVFSEHCNYRACIHGHTHVNFFRRDNGVAFVSTSQPQRAGIALDPPQIRVIRVTAAGEVTSTSHYGIEKTWTPQRGGAVWETRLAAGVGFCPPLAADGKVFCATTDDDGLGTGFVCALDPATGREIWKRPVRNTVKNRMALAGGCLIACDVERRVYAFRPSDGTPVWTLALPSSVYADFTGVVATPDGRRVVVGSGKALSLVEASTGKIVWQGTDCKGRFDEAEPAVLSPAVSANRIVLPRNWDGTYCLDLASGKILWQHIGAPQRFPGPDPLIDGTRVLLWASSFLLEYDLETGKVLRTVPMQTGVGLPTGAPLLTDDAIYCGSTTRGLMALDRKTLDVRWCAACGESKVTTHAYGRVRTERALNAAPILLGGGRLAGCSADGCVRVWDAATGKELRKIETDSPYLASPVLVGSRLVCADFSGYVRAFEI